MSRKEAKASENEPYTQEMDGSGSNDSGPSQLFPIKTKPVVPDWEDDYEHGQRVYVFQKNLTANLKWSPDETLMEYTRRVSAIPDFLLVGEGIVQKRLSVPAWSPYTGTLGDSVVYRVQMLSGSESGVCDVKSCHLARYER